MKVVNKLQVTSLYNRRYAEKEKPKPLPMLGNVDVIHQECDRPLQSKCWVESNSKAKFKPYYHDTMRKVYRYNRIGNYEVDRNEGQWHDVGSPEILAEQQRIFNEAKKNYEKSLRNEVTNDDKVEIATRQKSVLLLAGLHGHPNYNRIYGV